MKFLNSFHLKIIALITMLIDHLGVIFFEEYDFLRIVGRTSFILYAFMLVEGVKHTQNHKRYLSKLLIWAFISEIPFDLAMSGKVFNWEQQNIFWTLFLSALGIILLEKNKEIYFKILIPSVIFFLALIIRVDYSVYGVAVILGFNFCKKIKINPIIPLTLLNLLASLFLNKFQFFGFLGFIPISLYNGKQGKKTGKIFYSFYAVHLLVFSAIKFLSKWDSF